MVNGKDAERMWKGCGNNLVKYLSAWHILSMNTIEYSLTSIDKPIKKEGIH
jgi:hypothetical protein